MIETLTPIDSVAPTREAIQELEALLLSKPQLPFETRHYFSDGIYAREIDIPAGAVLTGKIHATEHLNILSKGSIFVVTEDGRKRLDAPQTIVARAGTKRVGYAITDCRWTTIHANPTNTRNMEQLEAALILAPEQQLETKETLWHGSPQ